MRDGPLGPDEYVVPKAKVRAKARLARLTPAEFERRGYAALATYNAEVDRGIVHTAEYAERMRIVQVDYDAYRAEAADR